MPGDRPYWLLAVMAATSSRCRTEHGRHPAGAHRHHGHQRLLPDPAGPWGGVKSSGIGRELGPGAIAAYQNLKTVYP